MTKYKETFLEKICRLEKTEARSFLEKYPDADNVFMCHGLRIWALEKLECIFQQGALLIGKDVPKTFESIDGKMHTIFIDYDDQNNTNNGDYISFAPSNGEFSTVAQFIRKNIFLAFNKDIDVLETFYLYYDEYQDLKRYSFKTKNQYSYVVDEYFASKSVSLDNLAFIGIDTANYGNREMDLMKAIKGVIDLMSAYEIGVPFIDISSGITIYEGVKQQKEIK